ncbi:MAG TPA: NAD(P) transhydrogenase subunit alpha [bacterium]|jgi:NAD(P) transhydrogenase subunit alpha|nr:NAD(P) transhydrogenase subunit alpha [bacterium]HPG45382.1 NAD(P) transhydrogenase subunit alpha [bacterium]HPM96842.1 NAD(P) transhydrogenase subunit alpha [bacterium]
MTNVLVLFGAVIFPFVVGYILISRVPQLLHTPLMSGANAISGITIIGAMLIAGREGGNFGYLLGMIAVVFATINVVGGFLVTDRMLQMFKKKGNKNPQE